MAFISLIFGACLRLKFLDAKTNPGPCRHTVVHCDFCLRYGSRVGVSSSRV